LIAVWALSACTEAESADTTTDIHCFLMQGQVFVAQGNDPIEQAKTAAAAFYYLGRLDAREPTIDLKSRMKAEAEKITAEMVRSSAGRCAEQQRAMLRDFVR
jgi:hypothetical protein